jgi:anthranilate phosphoribosyltransferase
MPARSIMRVAYNAHGPRTTHHVLRLLAKKVTHHKPQIRGPFREAAHEVRIPLGAVWHVDAHREALGGQRLLQDLQHLLQRTPRAAAQALVVAGLVDELTAGIERATQAIDRGLASAKLAELAAVRG